MERVFGLMSVEELLDGEADRSVRSDIWRKRTRSDMGHLAS